MSTRGTTLWPRFLLALVLCLPGAALAAETLQLESSHFNIRYKSEALSRAEADTAREEAERAWQKCATLFHAEPAQKIQLDLTTDFLGATGFARPGDLH